ncbi:cytochrome P450 CYP749A22-like [Papaver somniferum]|uniref:cytochrome P450 CYP749A22-like n=1 Tax=Papaver somniferum TaxID=3469 RepID=UPI000E6FBD84|nr:cytochrome P450 CYP749A22-like [Papaver somniferum]
MVESNSNYQNLIFTRNQRSSLQIPLWKYQRDPHSNEKKHETTMDIESDRLEREIRKSIIELIKKREEKAKKGELDGGYGNDYLGMLVKATHESDENKRISVQDVIDSCKTFLLAGHETTTGALTWTCLLLAIHTEWQDKARKEVFELFGDNKPNPYDNSLGKLKIMNMIINETLRHYPPTVSHTRRVAKEVHLGNKLMLPENMHVSVSTLALQHNPDIWGEDVGLFKPDRFSEGIAKATNNNNAAFLPFGLGPRFCVGSDFALTEIKIALSMILQHYHFTLSPAYIHSPVQRLTVRPQHGLQILLHTL